jgi:glycosyltransferase involved in cell wall biosynthesis
MRLSPRVVSIAQLARAPSPRAVSESVEPLLGFVAPVQRASRRVQPSRRASRPPSDALRGVACALGESLTPFSMNAVGWATALRVLFVNPIGGLGGAEQSLLDALAALRSAPGLELSLLLLDDGPLRQRTEELGIPVAVLPLPDSLATLGEFGLRSASWIGKAAVGGRDAVQYLARLSHFLRAARPDIVHTNGIKAHWLVCALRRGPTVLHFRDFVKERRLTRRALRPLCALGQRTGIAISHSVAGDLREAFPELHTDVVYDGIDTDALCPGPRLGDLLSDLAGLPAARPETISVGILGTYARWKGQDAFLRAAGEVTRALPGRSVRFYVIGGAIYRTIASQFDEMELRNLAASVGVADRAGFIPFQSDVVDLYRSLDIVVHASTRPEPFGRTIVEAMACGKPVVAMREGGAKEIFDEGVNALGADPRCTSSLAAAVHKLVVEPGLRDELGRRGREHVVANFSRARLSSDVLRVYGRFRDGARVASGA